LKYQYTSTKEIEKIITFLKSKNSHGYDDVSIHILKSSSPYIRSPLCHICNKMLSVGILPGRLKYAVVKPILKMETKVMFLTADPYSSYQPSPTSLKRLYM